ncbi:MAG TPA: sulfite exporter TauE/SafE family protein [Bryobacteraceae bacterium]|nr:sulfite exporter TauE/SafE family protein [Bryobacteraceae bacterium]
MLIALGFLISLVIGMTGIGGGTITVPVLMLFVHLAPDKTVGTALAFAAVVKLVAAPMFLVRKQVNFRVLGLAIAGGLPGLLVGLYLLHRLVNSNQNSLLTGLLGILIVGSALASLKRPGVGAGARDRSHWLPWLMLPIGVETGFSSAGAGAIGTVALLKFTLLAPAQVIGTNVMFGLALSLIGGGLQMNAGAYDAGVLTQLVIGGVFGALIGPNVTAWVPAKPLRVGLCLWLASMGSLLCWRAAL